MVSATLFGEEIVMSFSTISSRNARDTSRIAGFQKHYPSASPLAIGNASLTPAEVIQVYQSDLDAEAGVAAALAAYRTAVAKAKATRAATATFDLLVQKFVVAAFGNPPGPAGDFGIEATPRHPPTAETIAQAVVKREATREARHTMGSRQKLAVTGIVPATPPAPTVPPIVTK